MPKNHFKITATIEVDVFIPSSQGAYRNQHNWFCRNAGVEPALKLTAMDRRELASLFRIGAYEYADWQELLGNFPDAKIKSIKATEDS